MGLNNEIYFFKIKGFPPTDPQSKYSQNPKGENMERCLAKPIILSNISIHHQKGGN